MKLIEAAAIVRSKNAGPYLITFDIFFSDRQMHNRVREAGRLTRAAVAKAYGVTLNDVYAFKHHPFANATKFSMRRLIPSGALGDSDVYGAQQHAPLFDIVVL